MLTRKVYNKLAAIIHDIPDAGLRAEISTKIAGVLKEDNIRFNYSKWFGACNASED